MRKLLLLVAAMFLLGLSSRADSVSYVFSGNMTGSVKTTTLDVTITPIFSGGVTAFTYESRMLSVPEGCGLQFSVPEGKTITKITFGTNSDSSLYDTLASYMTDQDGNVLSGENDVAIWTGNSQVVTVTNTAGGTFKTGRIVYIYVDDAFSGPTPAITIDPAGPLTLGDAPVVHKVKVNGSNLSDDITITCPQYVTAVPESISKEDAEAGCEVVFTINPPSSNNMARYEVEFNSQSALPVTLVFSGKITVMPTYNTLAGCMNATLYSDVRYIGNALVTFVDAKSQSIFIQDGDIACRLYMNYVSNFDYSKVKVGDVISNFVAQIYNTTSKTMYLNADSAFDVLSEGNPVEPKIITLGNEEDFTNTRNMLVKIEGAKVEGTNYFIQSSTSSKYLPLKNDSGTTDMVLGAFAGTDVDNTTAPAGKFDLTGIRLYSYGVLPRTADDIVPLLTPVITTDPAGTIDLGTVEAPAIKTINVKGADLAEDITIVFPEYVTADKSVISKDEAMSEEGCEVTFTINPVASGNATYKVVLKSEGADPVSIEFSGNFVKPGSLEMPIEISDLTEITDEALYYHFTGEAVVTYVDKSNGYIYIQTLNTARQANVGYQVYVANPQVGLMSIGDRVTNMILKPSLNGIARNQLTLQANTTATDGMLNITGNETVEPKEVTLSDSWGRYELVTIKNVTFINPDNDTFGSNSSFGLKQGDAEKEDVVSIFSNSELVGTAVPKGTCDLTGLAFIPNMIYPRDREDIYVYDEPIIKVTLTPETVSLNLNKSVTLNVETEAENTEVEKIEWSSYYPEIASVDDDGVVTAHKLGNTVISVIVTSTEGTEFIAHANVSVVGVTAITVTPGYDTLCRGGEKLQLTATVSPDDDAVSKEVTWSSSNEAVATVDENGLVTPVAGGAVTITAKATDGTNVEGTASILVVEVESITVSPANTIVNVGETLNLTATVEPGGAIQAVTWSSSDEAVATVDENGVVTSVAKGTVTITATATDGTDVKGSAEITVNDPSNPDFLYGDSNNDGVVNIEDVVVDVQYILGKELQSFDEEKADVNQDGLVNIVDISLTVDIFLNAPSVANEMMAYAAMQTLNGLNVEDVDLLNSNTMTIALGSIQGITAMQADIEMPEGVSIKNIRLADGIKNHIVSFARHNDNRVRLALYSLSLAEIDENSPVLEIELESEGSFIEKYAHISNIYASNAETGMLNFEPVSVKLSNTAGIGAVYSDYEGSDVYTTQGILVKRNATSEDIKALSPGLYIIGGQKVFVK